jgi:hypothetical protein
MKQFQLAWSFTARFGALSRSRRQRPVSLL